MSYIVCRTCGKWICSSDLGHACGGAKKKSESTPKEKAQKAYEREMGIGLSVNPEKCSCGSKDCNCCCENGNFGDGHECQKQPEKDVNVKAGDFFDMREKCWEHGKPGTECEICYPFSKQEKGEEEQMIQKIIEEQGYSGMRRDLRELCLNAFRKGGDLEQEKQREWQDACNKLNLSLSERIVTLRSENKNLQTNVKELERVANEWMKDYDKLKEKYEPMIAILSNSSCKNFPPKLVTGISGDVITARRLRSIGEESTPTDCIYISLLEHQFEIAKYYERINDLEKAQEIRFKALRSSIVALEKIFREEQNNTSSGKSLSRSGCIAEAALKGSTDMIDEPQGFAGFTSNPDQLQKEIANLRARWNEAHTLIENLKKERDEAVAEFKKAEAKAEYWLNSLESVQSKTVELIEQKNFFQKKSIKFKEVVEKSLLGLETSQKYMNENYADVGCDESVDHHEPECCVAQELTNAIFRLRAVLKESEENYE